MAQFAVIFVQSSLGWLEGAGCGTDFVKVRASRMGVMNETTRVEIFARCSVLSGCCPAESIDPMRHLSVRPRDPNRC